MIKQTLTLIAVTAGLCIGSVASAQDISTGNFYGGTSVEFNADSASAFIGFENLENKFYYAVEGGYEFSTIDQIAVTGRAGFEIYNNFVFYGLAGQGWQVNGTNNKLSGMRYGLGGKYRIDNNFSVSSEFIHQEYGLNRSSDQTSIRGIVKF